MWTKPDVPITKEQIETGIEAALDIHADHSRDGALYASVHEQVVAQNDQAAFYVPAGKFALDATLSMLEIPAIRDNLSNEIALRSATATDIAQYHVGLNVVLSELLVDLYLNDPTLSKIDITPPQIAHLKNLSFIALLSAAPISDSGSVAGGALLQLQESGYETSDARETIQRSKGLLSVTGIPMSFVPETLNPLGIPYIKPSYFELTEDDPLRLSFTDEAQEKLARFKTAQSGCPAGRITIRSAFGNTILEEYWSKIIEYLVPDTATTEIPIHTNQ